MLPSVCLLCGVCACGGRAVRGVEVFAAVDGRRPRRPGRRGGEARNGGEQRRHLRRSGGVGGRRGRRPWCRGRGRRGGRSQARRWGDCALPSAVGARVGPGVDSERHEAGRGSSCVGGPGVLCLGGSSVARVSRTGAPGLRGSVTWPPRVVSGRRLLSEVFLRLRGCPLPVACPPGAARQRREWRQWWC